MLWVYGATSNTTSFFAGSANISLEGIVGEHNLEFERRELDMWETVKLLLNELCPEGQ